MPHGVRLQCYMGPGCGGMACIGRLETSKEISWMGANMMCEVIRREVGSYAQAPRCFLSVRIRIRVKPGLRVTVC